VTQVVEHGPANSVFGQGLEFQIPLCVKAINGLDEADRAGGHEIIEFDLRAAPMQASG
jgi:hypothetical protein